MVVTTNSDDDSLTGSGANENRGRFALLKAERKKRKHYAAPLHMAIILMYFTLRPETYFRGPSITPSRI